MTVTGQPIRRVEDPAILTGTAAFVDDLALPGMLHATVVRSTEARAVIRRIDVSEATSVPGVIAAYTAADLGEVNGPIPHPTWMPPNDKLRSQIEVSVRQEYLHLLAHDQVRYVGEPVAVVVASDPYVAADAARLVFADYDPLPAVVSVDDARSATDGRLVNETWSDNIAALFVVAKGDVAGAFAAADAVVGGTVSFGRQTGTPIEPRGVVADPTHTPCTVWSSTQAPYWIRNAMSKLLKLSHDELRVVAPAVGGGFGIKSMVYPEDLLIPLIARILEQPVKWIETRTENFLASVHSRDQRHEIEVAVRADGTILAVRDRFVVDVGVSNVEALVVPFNTAAHLQGCYRIPAVEIECECIVTNKAPLSAYRGAGRPEAVFAMERILDRAARHLDLAATDIRRVNLLRADEMPYDAGIPYRDGNEIVLDGGDYGLSFEIALERAEHDRWRAEQERMRESGRRIGIGLSTYVEGTGIGPREEAVARLGPDGRVGVVVALASQGQGHATTLAQVAADSLGVAVDRITVHQGDTHLMEFGGATIASRTAVVVGNAVAGAAGELRRLILEAAADALEADPADLEIVGGRVIVAGAPARSVSLEECARRASASEPDGRIEGRADFDPPTITFAHGVHVAVVEVNEVTGHVDVLRYVVVHDCGRVINPTIVEGQISGGVAQGIGGALSEELLYDESGQLTTASFLDYQIPRTTDLPDIEVHHVET
ncbi:MAG: xanthine dehydrogenase family protein molybdopterin-binding subunit, partial [Acidimicrobiales bacterium]